LLGRVGRAGRWLSSGWSDSAAAGDGAGAGIAACFMLVVSCALRGESAIYD